jgi:dGTPase
VRADRSAFQRDRDRIVLSNAFRRLVYKTKVLVNHEGDLYPTRITHFYNLTLARRRRCRAVGLLP